MTNATPMNAGQQELSSNGRTPKMVRVQRLVFVGNGSAAHLLDPIDPTAEHTVCGRIRGNDLGIVGALAGFKNLAGEEVTLSATCVTCRGEQARPMRSRRRR